jgi:hypothetical protein
VTRLLAALLAASLPAAAAARQDEPERDGLEQAIQRLERAWDGKDLEAYLAAWELADPELREAERVFAAERFAAAATRLRVGRPAQVPAAARRARLSAQAFEHTEPRGAVEQLLFILERRAAGWRVVEREARGRIEGLVHLSLDAAGFRADGLTLQLPDFALAMRRGTLFASPEAVGPTLLVFVGEAEVRVSPRPETEREQLRLFAGKPELAAAVRRAYVRIHPAQLHRVLRPARFEPDPEAGARFPAAREFFEQHVGRSFVLDAELPGSPWWLLPSLGDALVTFDVRGHGVLTFTLSRGEPEAISLFDRRRRRQICLYPEQGQPARYDEDESRGADVLSHELSVRFDPERDFLAAEDTLHVRLLAPALTLRLRLDDRLRVESVRSPEGGEHLFFRVRNQNALMVSLGPHSYALAEITLTVRYSGTLTPGPIESEVLQFAPVAAEDEVAIDKVLVYTNREAWYPHAGADDYALARLRFDVPRGMTAVSGGVRVDARVEAGRTLVEYRLDQPGKYLTVAVGRLAEAGAAEASGVRLTSLAVPGARNKAQEALEQARGILAFYTELFGPSPYPDLNLVHVEGVAPGGHSPPGMVVMSHRPLLLRGRLRDDPASLSEGPGFFLAHELAHQWWGQGVAGENYHERWLSEGFAQYAAALWLRERYGEPAFRDALKRMGYWARRYAGAGPISLGHRLGHLKQDPQAFRAVVYDKGAYVLHMLRGVVGEPAFDKALSSLLAANRFAKIGTEDLREALEAASGRPLAPYFEEWVRGTRLPRLEVGHGDVATPDGRHRTWVAVRAEALPGPVPLVVTLRHVAGEEIRRVMLEPGGGRFEFETAGRVRRVEVNDDLGLLLAGG